MLVWLFVLGTSEASDCSPGKSDAFTWDLRNVQTELAQMINRRGRPRGRRPPARSQGPLPSTVVNEVKDVPKEKEDVPKSETPYLYQYNNAIDGSGSCQNTSVAMVLNQYGVKITPDELSRRFGTDLAKTPHGLERLFNTVAAEAGIPQRITAHTDGRLEDIDALLDAGKPVIVNGWFTRSGHVIVTTGKTADGYKVNDPSGKWNGQFKGSYSGHTSTNGNGAVYSKESYYSSVATSNGSTFLPIWYYEISP